MYKSELSYYRKAFLAAAIIGVILLLPFVIIDGGYFIYYGDYNAQQIPFYTLCNQAIKNGEFMWSWQTDMGANFIGSYSFYTLGSPFFWLTMPFPAEFAKYLMAPLMVLKISCCSLFAFAYIRRFVKNPSSALIGGLLYAFSGFSMYNVFFNHFHEAMVVFPLMLIALEEAVINKRRVFFALTVALNAFVNYFFFAGECIFLVVYFLCRCTDKKFTVNAKTFVALAFESIVGVLLAGVMFVPAILSCIDVPRTGNLLNGWNLVFHNPSQRYGLIFQSLFFPADIPARQNFFPDSSARWSSVSAYLPLFSMAGVISFIKYKKKHWAKLLIPIMLLFALIPALNSTFVLFNSNYYTRWYYMPILVCCFMTSYALENKDIDIRYGIKWCSFAVVLISLVGILPSEVEKTVTDSATGEESKIKVTEMFSLPKEKIPFWISVILAVAALIACYFLVKNKAKLKEGRFLKKATCFTIIACMAFSYYTLIYGRSIGPKIGDYNSIVNAEIELDNDEDFYRVETFGVTNNANMLWDMYGFRSFHSILPGSAFEYYSNLGFNRSVNTDPDGSYYALRSLNSTKYLIVQTYKTGYKDFKELLENMRSFEKVDEQDGFTIYKNNAYVPMGYSYDYYLTDREFNGTAKSNRDNILLRAVYLSEEQIEKYGEYISELPVDETLDFSYDRYEADCEKLAKTCVDSFKAVANGFVATSSYDTDRFFVFSVPWESGWSATINGKPVEIEKVNGGVMGVLVPAGECEIVFDYFTPGLKSGALCTLGAAVLLIIYYIVLKKVFRYKPNPNRHLYNEEQLNKVVNHRAYIKLLYKRVNANTDDNEDNNSSDDKTAAHLFGTANGTIDTNENGSENATDDTNNSDDERKTD